MKVQKLLNEIERAYGFKKELIQDVCLCGLWHVRFTVNGIKYCGCVPYAGAEPTLQVMGYTYNYYWKGHPVEEAYYKMFIEGRTIYLKKCVDSDCGEWEWLEKRFRTEKEAVEYIQTLKNPECYDYDVKYEYELKLQENPL